MRVLGGQAAEWAPELRDSALAVGVFDGMHTGHRAVLAAVREHAAARGLVPGVVTFDPHPLAVVAPERAPLMLTDVEHRLELLAAEGMELVAVVGFDAKVRAWSPAHFAVGLLAGTLRARLVLAGEDFRFGKDRAGDVAGLRVMGAESGFDTVVIPLVGDPGLASSRALRALVAAGEVGAVAAELGRPHEVRGTLLGGARGAVVVPAGLAVPAAGAYAGYLGRDAGEWLPAVIRVDGGITLRPLAAVTLGEGDPARVRFVERLDASAPGEALAAAARRILGPQGS